MSGKRRAAILAIILALSALVLAGCELSSMLLSFIAPAADGDAVRVKLRLDVGEDIGLLLTDWQANAQHGMSGISNADGSMLGRNSTEYWEIERQNLDSPADTVELNLRFIVVTKYFEPNYDFDYPEEYCVPMEPVSFTAEFGRTYSVTITGNREDGYRAALETP